MAQIVYQPFSFNNGVKNVFSAETPTSHKVFHLIPFFLTLAYPAIIISAYRTHKAYPYVLLFPAHSTEARASPAIQNGCHIRCRKKKWKLKCSIRLLRPLRKTFLPQRSLAVDAEVSKISISPKCLCDHWICIFMDTVLSTQQ